MPSSMAMCLRARGSHRACLKKAGSVLRARAGRKNSSNAPLPLLAGAPYPHLFALAAPPSIPQAWGCLTVLVIEGLVPGLVPRGLSLWPEMA